MGEVKKAMRVLLVLKEYMDTHISEDEDKAGLYPVIVCNLAKWMNGNEKNMMRLREAQLKGVSRYA